MQSGWPEARHGRVLTLLVPAVMLLHAWLLGGGVERSNPPAPMPQPVALQVRHIVAPALPAPPVAQAAVSVAPARPAPVRARPVRSAQRPAEAVAAPPPLRVVAVAATAIDASALAPAAAQALLARAGPEPVAVQTSPAPAAEWPVYATRLPPSVTLRYDLKHGLLSGSGVLRWRLQGERYSLQLDGSVLGVDVLTQISQGGIDAAGVAPIRFTDQRVRRAVQAANFQRAAGKITFSGPALELPLAPGVQDRLSWMIQLAAVVDAEPARWVEGTQITLQVVGARGDADTWVFRCLGPMALDLPSGSLRALHLRREPRGPYDTTVDVWLDAQRHHLPVRAIQRSGREGDAFELRLRELTSVP